MNCGHSVNTPLLLWSLSKYTAFVDTKGINQYIIYMLIVKTKHVAIILYSMIHYYSRTLLPHINYIV